MPQMYENSGLLLADRRFQFVAQKHILAKRPEGA
jgi:hypothetical protein